jgi:predicted RNA-binding Zn-ribbon protein involved in translation (DUF1610 family)
MGKVLTTEEVSKRIKETFKQNVELVGEYVNRRTPLTIHCLDCDYNWSTVAQNVLYNDKHECPNCGSHIKQMNIFYCGNCGKKVIRRDSDITKNKSGYFYCSRECGNEHKNKMREESGEWVNSPWSYRRRAFEKYEHKCCVCDWAEDERILEVHHIDEDRSHNETNNLCILCPNCHRKITLGYYQLTNDFRLI